MGCLCLPPRHSRRGPFGHRTDVPYDQVVAHLADHVSSLVGPQHMALQFIDLVMETSHLTRSLRTLTVTRAIDGTSPRTIEDASGSRTTAGSSPLGRTASATTRGCCTRPEATDGGPAIVFPGVTPERPQRRRVAHTRPKPSLRRYHLGGSPFNRRGASVRRMLAIAHAQGQEPLDLPAASSVLGPASWRRRTVVPGLIISAHTARLIREQTLPGFSFRKTASLLDRGLLEREADEEVHTAIDAARLAERRRCRRTVAAGRHRPPTRLTAPDPWRAKLTSGRRHTLQD